MPTLEETKAKTAPRQVPSIAPPGGAREDEDQAPAPAAAKADAPPGTVTWYRVKRDGSGALFFEIPYKGPKIRLPVGKVLSSKNYDIAELENAGVPLEPIGEPGWHSKLNKRRK